MKILVTGSDGFIGSHVVEVLLRRGHEVRGLVQYNSRSDLGWLATLDRTLDTEHLEIEFGDVRDPGRVREVLLGCDSVINLAALIAIPYSYAAPTSYVETNVLGTLNLLEAARSQKLSRFVQLSTSEVYGSAVKVPMDENHPLSAQSPYAATKIASDQLAIAYFRSFDVPVVVARPFNAFGPRQSSRAVIPTVILQALSGSGIIRLGETESTRDYTFVSDLAEGLADIVQSSVGIGEVYNLGSGFEISVGQLVSEVAHIYGQELVTENHSDRRRPSKSEVTRLYSESSKASAAFGWNTSSVPPIDRFKHHLEATINWFTANRSYYSDDVRGFTY